MPMMNMDIMDISEDPMVMRINHNFRSRRAF